MKHILAVLLLSLAAWAQGGTEMTLETTQTVTGQKTFNAIKAINNVRYADQFAGADACVKIAAAITDLYAGTTNGGTVDARGFAGFQTCSVNPFGPAQSHPGQSVLLLLGAGSSYVTTAKWIVPQSAMLVGGGISGDGGGRGTTIYDNGIGGSPEIVVNLGGDTIGANGVMMMYLTVDCNHKTGSIGIYSDHIQEVSGIQHVSVQNCTQYGTELLDTGDLTPFTGGVAPGNNMIQDMMILGDNTSTCLRILTGGGDNRGIDGVTCVDDVSHRQQQGNLSCTANVVTATFTTNAIPNGASIGVAAGSNLAFGGVFTVTASTATTLQWTQTGCSGTASGAIVGQMLTAGFQIDGAEGVYSRLHCEWTTDCVLLGSVNVANGQPTRAIHIDGVTAQSSVVTVVHIGTATSMEDIVLTGIERCVGPGLNTGCATNVLRDDINSITLTDTSLAWYLLGHVESSATSAVLSSSPNVLWQVPSQGIFMKNPYAFAALGGQGNGNFGYCSDCSRTTPVTGSGTGAFVYRQGATWVTPAVIVASGTATFTTTAVAAAACQTTVTVAATGVLATDVIAWAYNSQPTAGTDASLNMNFWPTAGNVNFSRCNPTAASITPTAKVVNWHVVR